MQEKKFETALKKLEKVVERLESGELDLEESLKLYEEGVGHARYCSSRLEEAEKKVKKLMRNEDGTFLAEDFEDTDESMQGTQ